MAEAICRSREGAWIEMPVALMLAGVICCRSREGAWIEIDITSGHSKSYSVAPVRERGLKWDVVNAHPDL